MSLERARQAALVQAALRGDEHAREELGALAEEYLRRCFFRHARRCYGDGVKEELEDIASDAVEKCLARLDRFQGGRALFTTWVYGFAKNVLRNHHRKRARRDRIWEEVRKDQSAWWHEPPPDEPHFGGDPLRWVIYQEKLEALHLAMADLPVNDEVILTLRVAKARPEAETARQLKLEDEEAEKLYRAPWSCFGSGFSATITEPPGGRERGSRSRPEKIVLDKRMGPPLIYRYPIYRRPIYGHR